MPPDPPIMPPPDIFKPYQTQRGKIIRMLEWSEKHGVTGIECHMMIPDMPYPTATTILGRLVKEGVAVSTGEKRETPSKGLAEIAWLPDHAPVQPRKSGTRNLFAKIKT